DGAANALKGGDGNDLLKGGDGNDTENGEGGDDVFDEGSAPNGSDTMNGGAGTDKANYGTRTAAVTVTLDAAANDGEGTENDNVGGTGNTVENVIAGSGDDLLAGNALGNALTGGPGNDTADYSTPTAATAGVKVNLALTTPQNTIGSGVDTLATI